MLHTCTLWQVKVRFSKRNRKKRGRGWIYLPHKALCIIKQNPHIYVLPFGSKAIKKKCSEIQNISLWDKVTRWEQLNTWAFGPVLGARWPPQRYAARVVPERKGLLHHCSQHTAPESRSRLCADLGTWMMRAVTNNLHGAQERRAAPAQPKVTGP